MIKVRLMALVRSAIGVSIVAGCMPSSAADRHSAYPASSPATVAPVLSRSCGSTPLERSACMIDLILKDLSARHRAPYGGGISRITAGPGYSYSVMLPQEERVDIVRYDFVVGGRTVAIKSRTLSTKTP